MVDFTWTRIVLAELRGVLRSRSTVYLILIVIVTVTVLLELFAWFMISAFLFLTFAFMPAFFAAISSTVFSTDRREGFAEILYSYPVSKMGYITARLLNMLVAVGIFLAITLLMSLSLPLYGGAYWWPQLWRYASVGALIALISGLYGYNLSLWMGSRPQAVAGFLGFFVAVLFILAPLIANIPTVLRLEGETLDRLLAALHTSPTMSAVSILDEHPNFRADSLPVLGSAVAMLVALLGGLIAVYYYAQDPQGWRRGVLPKLAPLALVIVLFLTVIPAFGALEKSQAEVHPEYLPGGIFVYIRIREDEGCICAREHEVGGRYDASLFLKIFTNLEEEFYINDLTIALSASERISVDPTEFYLGSLVVSQDKEFIYEEPLTISVKGSSALGADLELIPSERISMNMSFGPYYSNDDDSMPVHARQGYRVFGYVAALILAAAAISPRLVRRLRSRRR